MTIWEHLEGWKTHITVALGMIACALWYYGILPEREYQIIIGLLGFGALSMMRWGQVTEARKVAEQVKEVKKDVAVVVDEASKNLPRTGATRTMHGNV